MSAQCIYCQSVRAKNTSRQRAHLLECPNYLNAMKEHNPQSSILELAANGTPTPASSSSKTPKKRDADTMVNGFPGDTGLVTRGPPVPRPSFVAPANPLRAVAYTHPRLERDLQLVVQLNPKITVGKTIFGDSNWISFISGHWSARWGKGTVSLHLFLLNRLPCFAHTRQGCTRRTRKAARRARPLHTCRLKLHPTDP